MAEPAELRRRDSDPRLDELTERTVRVETQVDNLGAQFKEHDINNARRFGEVHERITRLGEQVTRLQVVDDQHTRKLDGIDGKLDILLTDKIAADAVALDRIETIKAVPKALKWIAGTIAGIGAIGGGAWLAGLGKILTGG